MWFIEKFIGFIMVICVVVLVMVFIIDYTAFTKGIKDQAVVVTYDCRLAEISPDYPLIVKEQCRKLLK